MNDFIWSDLHMGHANVIDYESRPYSSVEQLNEALAENWRAVVTKHDRIWNLGDVALKMSKETLEKIIKNLPGKKILILGNHDRGRSPTWWHDVGFDEVYPYPVIYEGFYMLSHEPLYVNKNMPYVNVHGHTHGTSSDNPQQINVSVDVINFTPMPFEDIKDRFVEKTADN